MYIYENVLQKEFLSNIRKLLNLQDLENTEK